MNTQLQSRRALVLLSGGLDSQLAACVLRDQGLAVTGIAFESPFFDARRARRAAAQVGLELLTVNFTDEIVAILNHPRHGFGAALNPCIDCHAAMLRRAGDHLRGADAHFLATGEVLNQRPMSQNRRSLEIVAAESGYADLILRPLSAQVLAPTLPEREGWVDRARLLGLFGRTRKPQLALAAHYGLKDIPTPAGGCLLTEPSFCVRLRELKQHEGLGRPRDLHRLRLGRHYRLGAGVKLIVGRDQRENQCLEEMAEVGETILQTVAVPGPVGLLSANADEAQLQRAAAICAGHSDGRNTVGVTIQVRNPVGERQWEVRPTPAAELNTMRIA